MVQWTTTSSCCRTTRCPTLSVQQTSSTRQRSSLKVVNITLDITTHTHTNSSCRSYCLWVEFHGRVSAHPGDRGQVAVPGVQGVPIWSWHLYWSPLCHRPRSSSRTSRYCAYWTGHEIRGNVMSKMNLRCYLLVMSRLIKIAISKDIDMGNTLSNLKRQGDCTLALISWKLK